MPFRSMLPSRCGCRKPHPPWLVESTWGAVSGLLPVRFPRSLAEPAVRFSPQRALHGLCR